MRGKRSRAGGGRLTAILAFAIACGLVLLLAGGGSRPAVVKNVQASQKLLDRAQGALDAANYGAARGLVRQAQESLAIVEHELNGTPAERRRNRQ